MISIPNIFGYAFSWNSVFLGTMLLHINLFSNFSHKNSTSKVTIISITWELPGLLRWRNMWSPSRELCPQDHISLSVTARFLDILLALCWPDWSVRKDNFQYYIYMRHVHVLVLDHFCVESSNIVSRIYLSLVKPVVVCEFGFICWFHSHLGRFSPGTLLFLLHM